MKLDPIWGYFCISDHILILRVIVMEIHLKEAGLSTSFSAMWILLKIISLLITLTKCLVEHLSISSIAQFSSIKLNLTIFLLPLIFSFLRKLLLQFIFKWCSIQCSDLSLPFCQLIVAPLWSWALFRVTPSSRAHIFLSLCRKH